MSKKAKSKYKCQFCESTNVETSKEKATATQNIVHITCSDCGSLGMSPETIVCTHEMWLEIASLKKGKKRIMCVQCQFTRFTRVPEGRIELGLCGYCDEVRDCKKQKKLGKNQLYLECDDYNGSD